jgi:ketosteroid isomerase-like protein
MDTAALVDRMLDAYNRHDIDALAACYVPGARVRGSGWPEAVDADTWLVGFGAFVAAFPDLRVHPRRLAAGDGVALLEFRMTGTNAGPLVLDDADRLVLGTQAATLPATGHAIDHHGVVVFEVADGQVTAERHYWPQVTPLVQLGLVGAPGHAVGQHPAHEVRHSSISVLQS